MNRILIYNGTIVNRGQSFVGYIVVHGDRIETVAQGDVPCQFADTFRGEKIDARGKIVMPGVIDDQVHFRDPGLTYKGDMESESLAAVVGGVTSFMEMPNTKPPATTNDLLEQKFERAAAVSAANYSFYLGATNDNLKEIAKIDPRMVCGLKVFMGSSTGNMLVDSDKTLAAIFDQSPVLVATHCEDEAIIREDSEKYHLEYGDNILPAMHPLIRSEQACYRSTEKAVALADRYGTNLHVLHLSTAKELELFDAKPLEQKRITNEVCVHHLWFSSEDYARKGNMIKWNPAIKSPNNRLALRQGLISGKVDVVATDHAPHTLQEKQRPYWECPSGGPLVQHSLVAMLELAKQGVFEVVQVVDKMCHAPALRFGVKGRGFLDTGYYADIVIVNPNGLWTVESSNILYKCGWSPFLGEKFANRVNYTIINGRIVCKKGEIDREFRGSALEFER